MKPSLTQLAELYPGICINVTLSELLDAFRQLAEEIYQAHEEEREKEKEDDLITRDEALKKLGVSSSTLWRWDKDNYLKPVKHGARNKYHMRDIDRINGNG